MPYLVVPTTKFEHDIEYYQKKGFRHIIQDINNDVVSEIEKGNLIGDKLADMHLPEHDFIIKARACNSDARVGKSNGYRVIYYAVRDDETVYLLTVYYKKYDKMIPTDSEILELVKMYCI